MYDITCINERDATQKPQRLLCGSILANGSMKPAELKGRLTYVHPEDVPKDASFVSHEESSIRKSWDTSKISI
jgi:hypothetical protein